MKRIIVAIVVLLLAFSATDISAQRRPKSKPNPKQPFAMLEQQPEPFQPTKVVERSVDDPLTAKHNYYYVWVDLGLPSGLRWAACNYRASSPTDAGDYYGWGDSTPRVEYSREVSKSLGKDIGDISNNLAYDDVRKALGRGWRIPTLDDFRELVTFCNSEYVEINGCCGMQFTSRVNGQSIFLPLTGYKENWNFMDAQVEGLYWTSTPHSEDNTDAHVYRFNSTLSGFGWAQRHLGLCLRPVMDYVKTEKIPATRAKENGHEWIDLGLPSGTCWALCNVDAVKPSQAGKLYAWGELASKTTYSAATSKYNDQRLGDISGNAKYDVATAKWGGLWRMPTAEEFHELLIYCDWVYEKLDGRWGVKLTSSVNGATIFLPTTGCKWDNEIFNPNGCGNYWTSTQCRDNNAVHCYNYGAALGEMSSNAIHAGLAIRPVISKGCHVESPVSGITNDHEWVDLGLPSATKWATCNLGAEWPERPGSHYAWGEIYPINIKMKNRNSMELVHIYEGIAGDVRYDAATVAWGSEWQMPTSEQFQELLDNCTWEWTRMCRSNGYKVTSKINGNWIFLPCGGTYSGTPYYEYEFAGNIDRYSAYWTSTPASKEYGNESYSLSFNYLDSGFYLGCGYRTRGYSIRPVTK